MRVAAKFTLAILCCLVAALALRTYLEVRSGVDEFHEEAAAQGALIARALRPAVVEVWRADGQEHAVRVVAEANRRLTSVHIRWVPLVPGAAPGAPPSILDERLNALRSGEELVVFRRSSAPRTVSSFVPLGVPARWQSALQVSHSLQLNVTSRACA